MTPCSLATPMVMDLLSTACHMNCTTLWTSPKSLTCKFHIKIPKVHNVLSFNNGHSEVGWRPGQKTSLAPPCSNTRSFRSKCTVLKKILATLLGLFDAPAVIRRSGNRAPLVTHQFNNQKNSIRLLKVVFDEMSDDCWSRRCCYTLNSISAFASLSLLLSPLFVGFSLEKIAHKTRYFQRQRHI